MLLRLNDRPSSVVQQTEDFERWEETEKKKMCQLLGRNLKIRKKITKDDDDDDDDNDEFCLCVYSTRV